MRLADENRVLDGKANEARAIESRTVLEKMEWQHEKEVLQRHCDRLNEELSQKLDAHAALRASSTSDVRQQAVYKECTLTAKTTTQQNIVGLRPQSGTHIQTCGVG